MRRILFCMLALIFCFAGLQTQAFTPEAPECTIEQAVDQPMDIVAESSAESNFAVFLSGSPLKSQKSNIKAHQRHYVQKIIHPLQGYKPDPGWYRLRS